MSTFEQAEVVTSAAYHADTDDEDFDVKTSAVMDYDADTDDEGYAAAAAAAAMVVNKDTNAVCQEVGASNSSLPPSKRKEPSPEEEDRTPEKASGKRRKRCSSEGCTNQAVRRGVCKRHGAKRKLCISEGGKSPRALPAGAVTILRAWLLSPEHLGNPYPTPQEKIELLEKTGIDKKQLQNWFVNSRSRIWKLMLKKQLEAGELAAGEAPGGGGGAVHGGSGIAVQLPADDRHRVRSRKRKQPSPEEEGHPPKRASGKRRKRCSCEGCSNYAQRGGVCTRHGAKKKQCSKEGCTNNAQNGGVCIRHGAKRLCSSEGCTNRAQTGRVCIKHGARTKVCSKRKEPSIEEGSRPPERAAKTRSSRKKLDNDDDVNEYLLRDEYNVEETFEYGRQQQQQKRDADDVRMLAKAIAAKYLHILHNSRHNSSYADTDDEGFAAASSMVAADEDMNRDICREIYAADTGHSMRSRKRKQPSPKEEVDRLLENAARQWNSGYIKCCAQGCTNAAVNGIVCNEHGATKKMKRCNSEGCTNQAKKGGVCVRHGAKRKQCSSEGCTNKAVQGGVCIRHGAKIKAPKRCSSEGCTNQALKGGVCCRHGAYPIPYAR